jgi:hypothetical protein
MGAFMVLSGFDQTINLFSCKKQKPAVGGRKAEVRAQIAVIGSRKREKLRSR